MINLVKENKTEAVAMRDMLCRTMIEMAEEDDRVVALDADLVNAIGMKPFAAKFPDRMFDCGIQEADMIGIAAGISAAGAIPFTHTFSSFASRRCFDQIFLSACYADLNVKMIGSDPGVTAVYNGGTHAGMEDMGTLMSLPNITLLEPVDTTMLADLLKQAKDTYGVFYIRMNRKNNVAVYEEGSHFEMGKGVVLRDGTDVTIISSGIEVAESLKAASELEQDGISARVVNIFTWKPIDEELIIKCANETGAIVTAENHTVASGLGKAVAAVVCENAPVPMGYIGIQNVFGEVGDLDYQMKRFNLRSEDIVLKVKETIKKKK